MSHQDPPPAHDHPSDPTLRLLPDKPVASLDDHLARGGGRGLARALDLTSDEVIEVVMASGLRGRGGAGFPTGTKWQSIAAAARDEGLALSLVVNAAEGEPGTYKDRALLETDPYLVVEGVLIACHAIGAGRAYVGIKQRAATPRRRLEQAVAEAVAADWPGADTVEIVAGPDEYLFGEEKALLEVIEGKLPMPRHLAPYMNGLFTSTADPSLAVVNNIETLANVPSILAEGPEAFRSVGTEDTPGSLLFTVTGDVEAPGVYELPAGTPLSTLLVELAGADDLAFAVPGTSGAVITPELLDTPLDHGAMQAAGTTLGSGGYVVYDRRHCVVRVAATLLRFLAVESCGQCNACQLGTLELTRTLRRIDEGAGTGTDLDTLAHWTERVTDLARCGLPTGAQLIVASLLQRFSDELRAHIGRPCRSALVEQVPKIEEFDLDTGEVHLDAAYARKRSDWSYADEPVDEP